MRFYAAWVLVFLLWLSGGPAHGVRGLAIAVSFSFRAVRTLRWRARGRVGFVTSVGMKAICPVPLLHLQVLEYLCVTSSSSHLRLTRGWACSLWGWRALSRHRLRALSVSRRPAYTTNTRPYGHSWRRGRARWRRGRVAGHIGGMVGGETLVRSAVGTRSVVGQGGAMDGIGRLHTPLADDSAARCNSRWLI